MKKRCSGCRALIQDSRGSRCELGYKTEEILFDGISISAKPREECPKPTTYNEYLREIECRRNGL